MAKRSPSASVRKPAAPAKRARSTSVKKKRKAPKWRDPELIGGYFTERDLNRIERAAKMGMTEKQLCDLFEISDGTFQRVKKEEPRIERAYKKGMAQGIEYVTGKLFAAIRKGNIAAIIFYLKTRAGWRERLDLHGAVDVNVKEEFARVAQTLPDNVKRVIEHLPQDKMTELFDGLARPGVPQVKELERAT